MLTRRVNIIQFQKQSMIFEYIKFDDVINLNKLVIDKNKNFFMFIYEVESGAHVPYSHLRSNHRQPLAKRVVPSWLQTTTTGIALGQSEWFGKLVRR